MLLNKKDKLEQIIIDATYEMESMQKQINDSEGLEEKSDMAKILYDDLCMLKAEATTQLLRLRLTEVLDEDDDQEDDD